MFVISYTTTGEKVINIQEEMKSFNKKFENLVSINNIKTYEDDKSSIFYELQYLNPKYFENIMKFISHILTSRPTTTFQNGILVKLTDNITYGTLIFKLIEHINALNFIDTSKVPNKPRSITLLKDELLLKEYQKIETFKIIKTFGESLKKVFEVKTTAAPLFKLKGGTLKNLINKKARSVIHYKTNKTKKQSITDSEKEKNKAQKKGQKNRKWKTLNAYKFL